MAWPKGMATAELTDKDRQVLELAIRAQCLRAGEMENAIRDGLSMTRTQYDAALNRILRSPAAAAAYPVQVRLLNEARDNRIRVRGWR